MRLAAQAKLGWYPAAPEAIAALVPHLHVRAPDSDPGHILDPCAGEGRAIGQIGNALGVPPQQIYAVELDAGRASLAKANLPGGNVLGPASFLGVQVSGQSFGLAYVNPPFDDELGVGRREEQAFTERATRLLVPKGILVLVCPLKALAGNRAFCHVLDAHYDAIAVYKFPEGHRPYNEIVVIGRKRREAIPADAIYEHGQLPRLGLTWDNGGNALMGHLPVLGELQPVSWRHGHPSPERETSLRTWAIPPSDRPSTFKKTAFTDTELQAALAASPLNALLREVKIPPPLSPPLPLDKGHLGLILASGMLNGLVEGPHGVHVVRGSSHKVTYHNKDASTSEENAETGVVTTKEVFSERMVTVIRCVEPNGVLTTFSNDPKTEDDSEPSD
jgi:predicted RNA methylase